MIDASPAKLKAMLAAVALLGAGPGLTAATIARQPEVYTPAFSNLALQGVDPVAYFTDGRPVKGRPRYSLIWKGAEYRFATAENLARFRATPQAFAPQYGGYCAWAVSQGYTAKGDPNAWRIVGGKLYLNYDATVQRRWEADIPGHIARANANWPAVLK
jgi:YHS domain-containing protein